jgi:hypothetical protein
MQEFFLWYAWKIGHPAVVLLHWTLAKNAALHPAQPRVSAHIAAASTS